MDLSRMGQEVVGERSAIQGRCQIQPLLEVGLAVLGVDFELELELELELKIKYN